MKKYIILMFISIILVSCNNDKELIIDNNKNNVSGDESNCEVCNNSLWTKTGAIIGKDSQNDFKKEIDNIDKIIKKDGHINFDNIINKARYLEYTGQIGQSIKLYEENFYKEENQTSIVYNHNMAKLYETVGSYDLALERYKYLIMEQKRNEYLRDLGILYSMMGDEKKSEQSMNIYKKLFNNSNKDNLDLEIGVE